MKVTDKSIMFELWTECNNFCKFCYLGNKNRKTYDLRKLYNLHKVKKMLKKKFADTDEQYKAVGFLGGEFFQGQLSNPKVKKSFFELVNYVFDLINEDKVRDYWTYATLTIGDQKDLYELIDLFDKKIKDKEKHRLWILVSYDTWGRFHIPEREENWKKHMLNLQKYPFIDFNITSILSQDFCEKVLSGELDLNEMQKKYKTTFFFKQPGHPEHETKEGWMKKYPNWYVKRKTYLQFLYKLKKENIDLFNNVLNIEQRADDMLQSLTGFEASHRNKETWDETGVKEIKKCHHPETYLAYSDSDACCLCDYLRVKDNREC